MRRSKDLEKDGGASFVDNLEIFQTGSSKYSGPEVETCLD